MNCKKVLPQLVAWTTKPGDDYADLEELYERDGLGMWPAYMGHVATVIGGVNVDLKTADSRRRLHRRAEGEAEGRARVPRRERVRDAGLAGTEGHSVADRSDTRSPRVRRRSSRRC